MDGHSFYKPNSFKLDNIIKLRLACDTGAADPVAGILGKSCFVGTKHWIQVNVYTYKKVITVYNKYTATLCKCNRPRNDAFRGEYFNMILLATLLKICVSSILHSLPCSSTVFPFFFFFYIFFFFFNFFFLFFCCYKTQVLHTRVLPLVFFRIRIRMVKIVTLNQTMLRLLRRRLVVTRVQTEVITIGLEVVQINSTQHSPVIRVC